MMKNPLTYRFSFLFFLSIISSYFNLNAQVFERVENVVGMSVLANNNGIAVADYDGDNDLDIFIVAKAKDNTDNPSSLSRLFQNNNDGSFTDVTEFAGFNDLLSPDEGGETHTAFNGFKSGASWADYNNDGLPDLLLTYSLKVQLWRNLGNGTFINISQITGLNTANTCINTGATWFDYDNDGFLDIYLTQNEDCNSNKLFKNNGNNTFTDVTAVTGIEESSPSLSTNATPLDINNDGFMDLYVANRSGQPNYLFVNNSGSSFTEEAALYGLDTFTSSNTIALSDYDNDQDLDIFVSGVDNNYAFVNNGNGTFTDNADGLSLGNTLWSNALSIADFDLDGDEDVFIGNGYITATRSAELNTYFSNANIQGEDLFNEVSAQLALNELSVSVSSINMDYDNDGDEDLVVTNSEGTLFFYENKLLNFDDTVVQDNWFKIQLVGTVSNRDGIGSKVSINTASGTLVRFYSGVGFMGQSLKPVHFGLNEDTEVTSIEIQWPSGAIQNITDAISSNSTIRVTEGSGYELLTIIPSQKVYGCTDPTSCSYNPDAILDDGSCTYIDSQAITGNLTSSFLNTETYSYPLDQNSTGHWGVQGGEILSGQGTSSILVRWHIEDSGTVSIVESNDQCSSLSTSITVNLGVDSLPEDISIARLWNEALLQAIRGDFARPTVHARNLFHSSITMYDIWAIYDAVAEPYLIGNSLNGFNSTLETFTPNEPLEASNQKAISYAMYRLLSHRFQNSPSEESTQAMFDLILDRYAYDTSVTSLFYQDGDAAALGNFVAQTIIDYGLLDGSREATGYDNAYYEPVNAPYALDSNDNPPINDMNRWQPLGLDTFIDQGGNLVDGNVPPFLSPEWGNVFSFALKDEDKVIYERDGNQYNVFHDPSDPPYISLTQSDEASEQYKWGFTMVSVWQAHLDPFDGVMWDISPNSIGNVDISTFPTDFADYPNFYDYFNGGSVSAGHSINPITGNPYEVNMVPRGDYARVLAEFWADGPDSETPPGHWFTILNYVSDHPQFERRFQGQGDILNPLEWDVKAYFILGGGMHDAAIAAWSVKGWYDYIRPISAIRSMAERGQSIDPNLDNYDIAGIPLIDGYIEVIEEGDPLAGFANQFVGDIKLFTWKGHDFIDNTDTDMAGVGWIRADNWYPYQRPTFVTPPFAGYVSGHSTYSRTAAELLTMMTGSPYFPGGLGEFVAKQNEFLVFEEGPSVDVVLQWATYRDASDQTSLSRIWGGIHPPADDIPGRFIGQVVAEDTFDFAVPYFQGNLNIDEYTLPNQVAYPNPMTNNEITISNTKPSDKMTFFDIRGRAINVLSRSFDELANTTTLSFSNLSSGLYVLVVNQRSHKILVRN